MRLPVPLKRAAIFSSKMLSFALATSPGSGKWCKGLRRSFASLEQKFIQCKTKFIRIVFILYSNINNRNGYLIGGRIYADKRCIVIVDSSLLTRRLLRSDIIRPFINRRHDIRQTDPAKKQNIKTRVNKNQSDCKTCHLLEPEMWTFQIVFSFFLPAIS